MTLAVRLIIGLVGLFNAALGLMFLVNPAKMAADFSLSPIGTQGLATVRADMPAFFLVGGLFALLATGMILQLVWSKYGRMMKAVRDDEDAAIAMGVNTFRIKTCAFATSAFFEGIGGGLLASLLTTISPGLFDFMLTFQLLIIIVLGGLGSTTGALLGTVLVVGSGEWLRFLDQPLQFFGHDLGAYPGLRMVVFSLLLLIIMLFAREGLLGKKEIWQVGKRGRGYGAK